MENFDLLEAALLMRGVWRYASVMNGVLFVIRHGTAVMLL